MHIFLLNANSSRHRPYNVLGRKIKVFVTAFLLQYMTPYESVMSVSLLEHFTLLYTASEGILCSAQRW